MSGPVRPRLDEDDQTPDVLRRLLSRYLPLDTLEEFPEEPLEERHPNE